MFRQRTSRGVLKTLLETGESCEALQKAERHEQFARLNILRGFLIYTIVDLPIEVVPRIVITTVNH